MVFQRRIRVVVVDDSATVRSMVTGWIEASERLELVGVGSDGANAVRLARVYDPDVILLDVEMPGMSGLEALGHIMRNDPTKVVIMFSAVTRAGAAATMEALALGAAEYVAKPSALGGGRAGSEETREKLIQTAIALGRKRQESKLLRSGPNKRYEPPPSIKRDISSSLTANLPQRMPLPHPVCAKGVKEVQGPTSVRPVRRVDAVVIASSTGGPAALTRIIPALPADFPVPVLVVQHMPALFAEMLAERLNAKSSLRVKLALAGEAVKSGVVYVAPGGTHLEVAADEPNSVRCALVDSEPELSCKPAANVLFRSAAQTYGTGALGVVLTGMGQDGKDGASEIRRLGGRVIAQDEASSVVWGMPGAIVHGMLHDSVLPLDSIAAELIRRVAFQRGESTSKSSGSTSDDSRVGVMGK